MRAVVVEDEPLAMRALRELVATVDWLDLAGEASDGRTAVSVIDEARPDLLFLDVRLPELSGLEVLKQIRHDPAVVFTTAYDNYAVTAFELGAVDYLMKPFGPERFRKSMERVRRRLHEQDGASSIRERVTELLDEPLPVKRLFVRDAGSIVPVRTASVVRFEAADDYVVMHLPGQTHVLSTHLGDLEERLDPSRFLRVHRSHLVNLDHVAEMTPCDRRLLIRLSDGSEVLASRARSTELRRRLV